MSNLLISNQNYFETESSSISFSGRTLLLRVTGWGEKRGNGQWSVNIFIFVIIIFKIILVITLVMIIHINIIVMSILIIIIVMIIIIIITITILGMVWYDYWTILVILAGLHNWPPIGISEPPWAQRISKRPHQHLLDHHHKRPLRHQQHLDLSRHHQGGRDHGDKRGNRLRPWHDVHRVCAAGDSR